MNNNNHKQNVPASHTTVSIGYMREDNDFRILATLNNVDGELEDDDFQKLVADVRGLIQSNLKDHEGHIFDIQVLEREDAPDYVTLD